MEKIGRVRAMEKSPADLVTEADIESQKTVCRAILAAFPDHNILGEEDLPEFSTSKRSDFRWIIDPLDGTTNFFHAVPHFSVSVALENGGEILAATVFNPMNNECFKAEKAKGAFLNDRPIRVSSVRQLSNSLCAVGFPPGAGADCPDLKAFIKALPKCQALRRTGSAALNLCYVAAGRFDAAWSFSTKLWDMAAGMLLVEEAGGIVTPPDDLGQCLESGHFLAGSTKELHESLVRLFENK